MKNVYDLPEYYDIAFSWDLSKEIAFFQSLFKKHVRFEVKNVLEAACGSGRFLVSLPEYGYHITGFDINPNMLSYTRQRIAAANLDNSATVCEGDMRTVSFESKFDVALNSINSIGYLLTDDDIVSHFRCMGDSLRQGGIYIVQLGCARDEVRGEESDTWTFEREGVSVTTTWGCTGEDARLLRKNEFCRMLINDNGETIEVKEPHVLRLWFYEDLKRLVSHSGVFKLEAIYDGSFEEIALDTKISGENGNLYYILKTI